MFQSLFGRSRAYTTPAAPSASHNVQLQRQIILMALSMVERGGKKCPLAQPIIITDYSRTQSNDVVRVLVRSIRQAHPTAHIQIYRTYEEPLDDVDSTTSVHVLNPDIHHHVSNVSLSVSMATLQYLSDRPCVFDHTLLSSSTAVSVDQLRLYKEQAEKDLVGYLKARADEMQVNGQLIMSLLLNDPDPNAQGCSLLRDFSYAAGRLLDKNVISMDEFKAMTLPIHLRTDDEVNHALASVKDVFIVQEYSDRWIKVPAWSMFEEGTISRDVYAKTCVGFVASISRDWMNHALQTIVDEERKSEIMQQVQREYQQVIQENPQEGKFRFAVMRLERF